MKNYLDAILDFVFRRESVYAETVSGALLLALAFQSKSYFMTEYASSTLLMLIGSMQLSSLWIWRCRQCFATRILTAAAGAFAWVVVASHQYGRTATFDGSTLATLIGSLVLSATMLLAAVNTLRVRQRENDTR